MILRDLQIVHPLHAKYNLPYYNHSYPPSGLHHTYIRFDRHYRKK